MAMIVQSSDYRTPDGAYSVSTLVTYEPKTSLHEVNIYVNGCEVERAYFDDSKAATVFAATGQLERWLQPNEDEIATSRQVEREVRDTPLVPCGKFRL